MVIFHSFLYVYQRVPFTISSLKIEANVSRDHHYGHLLRLHGSHAGGTLQSNDGFLWKLGKHPNMLIYVRWFINVYHHFLLVGGLFFLFIIYPFSWEFHHPNWRSLRGVGIPPTSHFRYWNGNFFWAQLWFHPKLVTSRYDRWWEETGSTKNTILKGKQGHIWDIVSINQQICMYIHIYIYTVYMYMYRLADNNGLFSQLQMLSIRKEEALPILR